MLLLLLIGAANHAAAAENAQHAKELYRDALKHYNVGEYNDALAKFKTAYLELPDPAFLFNIAQCQRQLGDYAGASKSYRAFLREGQNLPQGTRDDVQRLVAEMDAAARDQHAKQPPTGTQPPAGEPANLPPTATPPVAVTPPPAPTPVVATPAPPPPRPWYKNPAGIALGAAGVAGVVVGGTLLGVSLSDDKSAKTAPTLVEGNNLHDSAVTFNTAGWVITGIGIAALASGVVVLALAARRAHHHDERAQVSR